MAEKRGSLTLVGTGIRIVSQITPESRVAIESADKVLYVVADQATGHWLQRLNPSAESMHRFYDPQRPRHETYDEMVRCMLEHVRRELDVCGAFYGHPGVFADPCHHAIRQARAEGFPARMLPAISAEDCLFADLGLDPGAEGCQSFEATKFLLCARRPDVTVPLVLWQVGAIGIWGQPTDRVTRGAGLAILAEALQAQYGPDHEVVVYSAAVFPGAPSSVRRVCVGRLADTEVETMATLFVPPLRSAERSETMAARLGC